MFKISIFDIGYQNGSQRFLMRWFTKLFTKLSYFNLVAISKCLKNVNLLNVVALQNFKMDYTVFDCFKFKSVVILL